jgi:hypothetical protein
MPDASFFGFEPFSQELFTELFTFCSLAIWRIGAGPVERERGFPRKEGLFCLFHRPETGDDVFYPRKSLCFGRGIRSPFLCPQLVGPLFR